MVDTVQDCQAVDVRFLSDVLHFALDFCCSFQNRLTGMPAELQRDKAALQKASLLGRTYCHV